MHQKVGGSSPPSCTSFPSTIIAAALVVLALRTAIGDSFAATNSRPLYLNVMGSRGSEATLVILAY
jgi:hypothetical protein